MVIELDDEERDHLITAIKWSPLNEKMYLWKLLERLQNGVK